MKALCAVLIVVCATSAAAHPLAQGAIDLEIQPGSIELRVQPSLEEMIVANTHAHSSARAADQTARDHASYLLAHIRIEADGDLLQGVTLHFAPAQIGPRHAQASFTFRFPTSHQPRSIRLEQDVLNEFEFVPGNRWEATYLVTARSAAHVLAKNALLTSKEPLVLSASAHASPWRTAFAFIRHGVHHILAGYDHLLFIAALALAVTSFWELFKIIAAFTLAHTITLTLSVLDIVRLPSPIVEPLIAASIILVALQNMFWARASWGSSRLAVAFCFGLFHGLGFAGGLLNAMSEMPAVTVGLAIGSFSAGVELGHQLVVLPLFALTNFARGRRLPLQLARQSPASDWLLRGGSALIFVAGTFYLTAALLQATILNGRK